jgi:hypothetical protein
MGKGKLWLRGVVTLGLVGAVAAGMVVAPAGAHLTNKFGHLKKHINQIAKKQANQVFDSKIGSASVANADKLDNLDSGDFQKTSDLLFAVVNNAGTATATLVRGRGATGVSAFFVTNVSFNRPINTCAWTATSETGGDQTFATVDPGPDNSTVTVTLFDDTGTVEANTGEVFHLVVVCP